jgi:serine/threonine-protein kinase HipA
VRDAGAFNADTRDKGRLSESWRGATHIVKFWEPNEFPQLALNESLCLEAARRCGLDVPTHRLSDDGTALVVDRFDLRGDGSYRGFEDFCVLNARRTEEKYRGSYETAVMKRFQQFASSPHVNDDLVKLCTLIVLNCALRNGDAHLKNFGIVYDHVLGEARLAPAYDLVTTTVYLPADRMALTLNGSTEWPDAKGLRRLGETRAGMSPVQARQLLERAAAAISDTIPAVQQCMREREAFAPIGSAMLQVWESGRRSLQG